MIGKITTKPHLKQEAGWTLLSLIAKQVVDNLPQNLDPNTIWNFVN
jgi:hypothetical protein